MNVSNHLDHSVYDVFIYNNHLLPVISTIHHDIDACSDTSTSQHCHIVEGKLTLFVQDMNDDNEEDRIISKIYTTIELVFHSLDTTNNNNNRDTSDRLSYIGNNPVSLLPADWLTEVSQNTSSSSSEDAAGIFITIFLVLSVCGCLSAIVVLCTFSRRLVNNKEESLYDSDDEESQMKSRASNNTLSSSSGGSSTDPIDTKEVEEVDWNRMVYIESLALSQPTTSSSLSRVPEDTSVDYGCADEWSI